MGDVEARNVELNPDGTVDYRASSLGGCDLALLAARLEYEAIAIREDAPILKVFQAGHDIEDEILTNYYPSVRLRQHEVVLPVTGRLRVVGHIDGFDMADGCIVEVKSQSQDEWDNFEKNHWNAAPFFPKYKWQVSAYMLAMGTRVKLIRAKRDSEGAWTGDTAVSYVDVPFYDLSQIRERILKVEAAAATGTLMAVCTPSFPCPYFYLHEDLDRELIDDDGVEKLAREYKDAQRDEAAAKGRKESTKKALRQFIVGEDNLPADGSKKRTQTGVGITFYWANNPASLDSEMLNAFLKTQDRTLEEFQKKSRGERLRITLPKEP